MSTTNTPQASDHSSASFDEQAGVQQRVSSETTHIQSSKRVQKSKDAFRTISEVADKLDVQQHVLRFWETKFSQVRPLKRGGGRRYYRPEDVALLERIHNLLYTQGYTIKGVQKLLKEQGKAQIIAQPVEASNAKAVQQQAGQAVAAPAEKPQKGGVSAQQRAVLEIMLAELKAMRAMIKV